MYRYNIPIHVLRSNQGKCKKKIAAAIYEYQADCDGEWGEISFDFENGTEEIIRLADWDTIKTKHFANKAVAYLLNCENEELPKEIMVAQFSLPTIMPEASLISMFHLFNNLSTMFFLSAAISISLSF